MLGYLSRCLGIMMKFRQAIQPLTMQKALWTLSCIELPEGQGAELLIDNLVADIIYADLDESCLSTLAELNQLVCDPLLPFINQGVFHYAYMSLCQATIIALSFRTFDNGKSYQQLQEQLKHGPVTDSELLSKYNNEIRSALTLHGDELSKKMQASVVADQKALFKHRQQLSVLNKLKIVLAHYQYVEKQRPLLSDESSNLSLILTLQQALEDYCVYELVVGYSDSLLLSIEQSLLKLNKQPLEAWEIDCLGEFLEKPLTQLLLEPIQAWVTQVGHGTQQVLGVVSQGVMIPVVFLGKRFLIPAASAFVPGMSDDSLLASVLQTPAKVVITGAKGLVVRLSNALAVVGLFKRARTSPVEEKSAEQRQGKNNKA